MAVEHTQQIDEQDHISMVLWAADCAERVLPYFEGKHPQDDRPRKAIEAARAWVCGEMRVGPARAASAAAHAAARAADEGAARSAARAAGQAVATAHMAGHARHAAAYAVKAVAYAAANSDADAAAVAAQECDWQRQHLPEHLRSVVHRSS